MKNKRRKLENLAFKEVFYNSDGNPKGNCDADLVLDEERKIDGKKIAYKNPFNLGELVK